MFSSSGAGITDDGQPPDVQVRGGGVLHVTVAAQTSRMSLQRQRGDGGAAGGWWINGDGGVAGDGGAAGGCFWNSSWRLWSPVLWTLLPAGGARNPRNLAQDLKSGRAPGSRIIPDSFLRDREQNLISREPGFESLGRMCLSVPQFPHLQRSVVEALCTVVTRMK